MADRYVLLSGAKNPIIHANSLSTAEHYLPFTDGGEIIDTEKSS